MGILYFNLKFERLITPNLKAKFRSTSYEFIYFVIESNFFKAESRTVTLSSSFWCGPQ